MANRNNVSIDGRLVRDPEMKQTASGTQICSFSIAVNDYQKDKDDYVNYIDCIAWSAKASAICSNFKKGNRISIDGKLRQTRWEDSDGKKHAKIEIYVTDFYFIDKKENVNNSIPGTIVTNQFPDNPFDDDIPF